MILFYILFFFFVFVFVCSWGKVSLCSLILWPFKVLKFDAQTHNLVHWKKSVGTINCIDNNYKLHSKFRWRHAAYLYYMQDTADSTSYIQRQSPILYVFSNSLSNGISFYVIYVYLCCTCTFVLCIIWI